MQVFNKNFNKLLSQFINGDVYENSLVSERYTPVLDVLEKYKDDDNAFLSFTGDVIPTSERRSDIDKKSSKIGINPRSPYDTPIGVYCYPIKAYWKNIESNRIHFPIVPSPHLYVFKAKNPERILVASEYTLDDYTKDFEKLDEIFSKLYDVGEIEDDLSMHSNYFDSLKPAQLFWTLTREIAHKIYDGGSVKSNRSVIWTQILRRFYDGVVDDKGWGFIHSNEPIQAVLWTKAQFDVVDYINRKDSDQNSYKLKPWREEDKTIPENKLEGYVRSLKAPIRDEKMLSYITKSYYASYLYAADILKYENVPNEMLKSIASKPRFAFLYANGVSLIGKDVPDIILKSVLSDSDASYNYAVDVLRSNGVPIPEEVLESIASDPKNAYKYAELLNGNVPDVILKSIASDSDTSFKYAAYILNGKDVPDEILKSISDSSNTSYNYASAILKWEDIPDSILEGMAKSSTTSRIYASNILKGNNVPDVILKGISKNPEESFKYASDTLEGKNVPDVILRSIASSGMHSIDYAKILKGVNVPAVILRGIPSAWSDTYIDGLENDKNLTGLLDYAKSFENPLYMTHYLVKTISKTPGGAFKFINDVLIPKGFTADILFNSHDRYHNFTYPKFAPATVAMVNNSEYAKYIAKKYFNWTNVPKVFEKILKHYDLNMVITGVPETITFKESFEFVENYNLLLDSFTPESYDMDRIYELFNQEYIQSTGKSWTKDKFLNRAKGWEFWGDENGFAATRRQQSGFIKLVGAAGSNKSKYKGFKELINKNLPVWGLVDATISNLLEKLNYRGPNMIERVVLNQLLKSGKMQSVLGDAKIEKLEGDKLTLTYPDIGTVEKYFMGSPEYWKHIKSSLIDKGMMSESLQFDDVYSEILEKYTKKKKKKVSPLRSKCQAKAKAKYEVWPSAYASGYVQKCVKRKGKMN
jgi:hypothetical protein